MTAFRGGVGTWVPKDVNEITRWDSRISVIDQFQLYRNIPRDSVSVGIRRFMDYNDEKGESRIIRLRGDVKETYEVTG